jgi:SAM-dependent methyltransferase
LSRYFPDARSLLEVGCGTGFVLSGVRQAYPHLRLAGADLHERGLAHASKRLAGVDLLQFDARAIPFSCEFDVVGAFDVLEHVEEDERVLAELHTAARPNGGIVLTVPQHPWLWSQSDEYAEHKRRYKRRELLDKVSAAGFAVRRVTSFMSVLLPLMTLSRVRSGLRSATQDPLYEHLATQRIAAPLELVLTFERRLIERGVNFPVGGSMLVVAEK